MVVSNLSSLFTRLTRAKRSQNEFFTVFCIVVFFLIIDTVVNTITDSIPPAALASSWSIAIFIGFAVAYGFGVYFVLHFVRANTIEIRAKNLYLQRLYQIIITIQGVLAAIFVYITGSILVFREYSPIALIGATIISAGLTICVSALFVHRFLTWFSSNKSSLVVLLYGLSFAISAYAIAQVTVTDIQTLLTKEPMIVAGSKVVFASDYYEPGSLLDILWSVYSYSSVTAFILVLSATGLLLRHYSDKIGKIRFWIIILLPLIYQLTLVIDETGIYVPKSDTELFYYYLFASLNSTAGGILFGIAFWTAAKKIREDSAVRTYMIITACGFILYFICTQVGLYNASYPPFGFATFSILGLSTYLIFLGLYSSAISVSQDNKLRASIKKLATQDSNLLSSIGTAHMEKEIQRTVNSMKDVVQEQEKELEEQTGIEANLEEDEMKKYLEEVMQEVGKSKKPSA